MDGAHTEKVKNVARRMPPSTAPVGADVGAYRSFQFNVLIIGVSNLLIK